MEVGVILCDFSTDLIFTYDLWIRGHELRHIALLFIGLPLVINYLFCISFFNAGFDSEAMRKWWANNSVIGVATVIISGAGIDCIGLIYCYAFNHEKFDAPTEAPTKARVMVWGIVTNVLEDMPQIILQIMVLKSGVHPVVAISITTSVFALVYGVFNRLIYLIVKKKQYRKDYDSFKLEQPDTKIPFPRPYSFMMRSHVNLMTPPSSSTSSLTKTKKKKMHLFRINSRRSLSTHDLASFSQASPEHELSSRERNLSPKPKNRQLAIVAGLATPPSPHPRKGSLSVSESVHVRGTSIDVITGRGDGPEYLEYGTDSEVSRFSDSTAPRESTVPLFRRVSSRIPVTNADECTAALWCGLRARRRGDGGANNFSDRILRLIATFLPFRPPRGGGDSHYPRSDPLVLLLRRPGAGAGDGDGDDVADDFRLVRLWSPSTFGVEATNARTPGGETERAITSASDVERLLAEEEDEAKNDENVRVMSDEDC